MFGSVLNGVFAAAVVCSVLYLQERAWATPYVLALVAAAAFMQWFWIDRKRVSRSYNGLADMVVYIHAPTKRETSARWAWKGMISWCFSWLRGIVGPEGAAAEWNYSVALGFGSRTSRWFEQRRRTDAACVLSAAVAAAFGAPFTAVLIPVELGIGGRLLSSVVCALTATIASRTFRSLFNLRSFDLSGILEGLDFSAWQVWVALALFGVMVGAMAGLWLRFTDYSRRSLERFAPMRLSVRMVVAGFLFILLTFRVPLIGQSSQFVLQDLFLNHLFPEQAGFLFFGTAVSLTLILVGFGTMGVFWPVFAMGGFFGFAIHHGVYEMGNSTLLSGTAGYAPLLALAGGAAFWGAVLDIPVASCILVFELTGEIQAALLCLGASLLAQKVARLISASFVSQNLQAKGLHIVDGRSTEILQHLKVADAMVSDHETIHEDEPVSQLPARLLASRYPFLPVVNKDQIYTGLVTVDMVQDRLKEAHPTPGLARIFEVKDLLYSSGFKTPTLRPDESLSATRGMFQDIPCVPVLSAQGHVQGLLFVHHVRLAYEKEVARRSLKSAGSVMEIQESKQPLPGSQ